MTIRITLLISKTIFRKQTHPYTLLQSKIIFYLDSLKAKDAFIDVEKGIGVNCMISRTEEAFIKFLLINYGVGKFVVKIPGKKFANFWNGYIERDRYIREKGSIAPYLKSNVLHQWNSIEFQNQNDDDDNY